MNAAAPGVLEGLTKVDRFRKTAVQRDMVPEDSVPTDFSLLLTFEHEGQRLNSEEIAFITQYVTNGLRVLPHQRFMAAKLMVKPIVLAALHELTADSMRRCQMNVPKLVRELANIIDGNITDIVDAGAKGLRIRDLSDMPRNITAAVKEIHETRNSQGRQMRVLMYDKLQAMQQLATLLGLNKQKEATEVTVELGERLTKAIERASVQAAQKPAKDDIMGEVVHDGKA